MDCQAPDYPKDMREAALSDPIEPHADEADVPQFRGESGDSAWWCFLLVAIF